MGPPVTTNHPIPTNQNKRKVYEKNTFLTIVQKIATSETSIQEDKNLYERIDPDWKNDAIPPSLISRKNCPKQTHFKRRTIFDSGTLEI